MLARAGVLPDRDGYAYEVKWDGFRAIVSTTGGLRVRSRRGWNMTKLVPELANLPPRVVLDGELIAFGEDGKPDFPRLCRRMLHGERGIAIMFVVFDLLAGVWWALVTVTTVGFGDISPKQTGGRIIGMILMFVTKPGDGGAPRSGAERTGSRRQIRPDTGRGITSLASCARAAPREQPSPLEGLSARASRTPARAW
jgi:Ion channel/ATP dependent DNA ligase domain